MAKKGKRKERLLEQLKAARNARIQKCLKARNNVKTEEWSSFDDQCGSEKTARVKCDSLGESIASSSTFLKTDDSVSVSLPSSIKSEQVDEPSQSTSITIQLPMDLQDLNVPYHPACSTPKVSPSDFEAIIRKPHFDVMDFEYCGKELKRLVIYKPDDPSLCVEFGYNLREKVFYCNACSRQDHKVFARFIEEPEPAVIVEKDAKHVCCYGKTRTPQPFEKAILRSPDVKLSNTNENNNTYSLIVYISIDQKLCYEYKMNKGGKKYYCIGCKKKGGCASANVCIDSNDEYFVELDGQKHICSPIALINDEEHVMDASKYEIEQIGNSDKYHLIVYTAENRKYAYELRHHRNNSYYCYPCFKFCGKKLVHAQKSQDGVIDTVYDNIPHVCQPRSIPSSTFVNNIATENLPVDETSIIIDSTMFEINNSFRRIFVFCRENRNYCYQLASIPTTSSYYCIKCNETNHLCQPCAKLCQNSNGDHYLEALTRPHLCQPYPYSPASHDKTIHNPNFSIYNRSDPNPKHRRVIVFASDDKKMFYEFVWLSNKWRCQNCMRQKKDVNVKLMMSNDGLNEEYLLMGKNAFHICEPQRDFAGIYSRNL